MPERTRQKRPPPLDRFRTHREMVASIPAVKKAAGWPGVAAMFALWDRADGRTGVAALSMRQLARAVGVNFRDASKALAGLTALGVISPVTRADGTTIRGKWKVFHLVKEPDD